MTQKPSVWIGLAVLLFVNASWFVAGLTPTPPPGTQVQEFRQLSTTRAILPTSGWQTTHRITKVLPMYQASRAGVLWMDVQNDQLIITYLLSGEKVSITVSITV